MAGSDPARRMAIQIKVDLQIHSRPEVIRPRGIYERNPQTLDLFLCLYFAQFPPLLANNIKSFVKARDFCQALSDPYHCPSSFFIHPSTLVDMAQHSAAVLQHVEDDPTNMSRTLDPFTVTTSNGFMPLQTPETKLPKAFDPLIKLCERMPIVKEDGSPGLLASYQLGPTIDLSDALPDLTDEIDNLLVDGKPDLVAATAIFRDYAFLASAYLLEPCWEKWSKDSQQGYGLGRQRLPRNLAGPLTKTAKL
jgi:hypothetical protein